MNLYFNGEHNAFRFDPTLANYIRRSPLNPINPSYGSDLTTTPQLDMVQFGNGYAQVTPSGSIATLRKFKLTFANRPTVIITALRRFLRGESSESIYNRSPAEFFFWTPPEMLGLPYEGFGKWLVPEPFQVQANTYNSSTLTVTFQEWIQP